MDYYLSVLKNYAEFSGRARRAEYWYFALFNMIIAFALGFVGALAGDEASILGMLYSLAIFIPAMAVLVRRLHDTNRSGWWFLIVFVPLVGVIVLLVFLVSDSQPGSNEYGPNPKEGATAQPQPIE